MHRQKLWHFSSSHCNTSKCNFQENSFCRVSLTLPDECRILTNLDYLILKGLLNSPPSRKSSKESKLQWIKINHLGKTGAELEKELQEFKDGTILAPIEIIVPVEDAEEEEVVEEKPKKKKKKVKRADKVRNLTLSLGEAMRLIMEEEVKSSKK